MNKFTEWFSRSQGNWTSSRRYLMGKKRVSNNYDSKFSINPDGDRITISWAGDVGDGTMNMVVDDDVLRRDIGYFTDDPTASKMTMVDKDTVVFVTSYDGVTYREEIRLLEGDGARLRQTVATNDEGDITLVGQYFEERA